MDVWHLTVGFIENLPLSRQIAKKANKDELQWLFDESKRKRMNGKDAKWRHHIEADKATGKYHDGLRIGEFIKKF